FRDLAKAGEAGSGADDESQNSEAAREGEPDGATTPTLTQFAEALAAGQATVQKYGEAEVGDKTMVDALDPAVTTLRAAADAGKDPAAALDAAEQAASDAARATAESTARRGRASYVCDASKGAAAPGSAAMVLILVADRAAAAGPGVFSSLAGPGVADRHSITVDRCVIGVLSAQNPDNATVKTRTPQVGAGGRRWAQVGAGGRGGRGVESAGRRPRNDTARDGGR